MKSIVIGLGYKARNGKDTVTAEIVRRFSDQYSIGVFPFAKALKDEYTAACVEAGNAYNLINNMRLHNGLPEWVQYEIGADHSDPLCPYGKQRKLLQWWGTEYRREQDPFYWVKKTHEAIVKSDVQFAIISDMRFFNEFAFVKNFGRTVKVTRNGYVDLGATGHASEHQLDPVTFDYEINANEGDVDELKRCAGEVFQTIVDEYSIPNLTTKDFTEDAFPEAA